MSPRTELISLLLSYPQTGADGIDRFPLEERAAMLGFLTRYGYIRRTGGVGSTDVFGSAENDRYTVTDRGRALLTEIVGPA